MSILKLTTATLVAATMATASFAGTIEPMEDDTMVDMAEEATGSSAGSSGGGILLPLLGLAVVAALIASDDS